MITQKFKGDETELKFEEAGRPPFDICSASLDAFFADGYEASDFLLMLYDANRMPFTERVPRDSFVGFFKQALPDFPITGTFEAYLLIVESVFGEGSSILFDVPAAGKLEMLINASTSLEFTFAAREFVNGEYALSDIITMGGETIQFRGLSGIDSEAEITQLLSELIPDGIFPDVTLAFFALYDFIAQEGALQYSMLDHLGNQIVFFET